MPKQRMTQGCIGGHHALHVLAYLLAVLDVAEIRFEASPASVRELKLASVDLEMVLRFVAQVGYLPTGLQEE